MVQVNFLIRSIFWLNISTTLIRFKKFSLLWEHKKHSLVNPRKLLIKKRKYMWFSQIWDAWLEISNLSVPIEIFFPYPSYEHETKKGFRKEIIASGAKKIETYNTWWSPLPGRKQTAEVGSIWLFSVALLSWNKHNWGSASMRPLNILLYTETYGEKA